MPGIIPENEPQRMAAVNRYDILDTPPDGSFDRITAIAARRFRVPISIISIVDHDRIWFKSHHGLAVEQIGRDPGLCASAILSPSPHLLTDARADPRSLANPLVAGDFGLRFYAGVPLTTSDGYNLGTLCVIDREARPIDQDEIDELKDLAAVVMDQMELRIAARKAVARAEFIAGEFDHRVKNSLQFVSAMLNMQGRLPDLPSAASEQLQIAANRVAAVARVHQNFYTDVSAASPVDLLRRLCADLSSILGTPITVDGDDGNVETVHIQPIGLMVNELVTNAAKHGSKEIKVLYRISGDVHELSVCDDGDGLPPGFDPEHGVRTGLGMKVVSILASQVGGRLTAAPNPRGRGSCFAVAFRP